MYFLTLLVGSKHLKYHSNRLYLVRQKQEYKFWVSGSFKVSSSRLTQDTMFEQRVQTDSGQEDSCSLHADFTLTIVWLITEGKLLCEHCCQALCCYSCSSRQRTAASLLNRIIHNFYFFNIFYMHYVFLCFAENCCFYT